MKVDHYLRFIKKLFIKGGSLPEQITFFVTNRCNLSCQHCFFWEELNKPTKELSLEEIEKVTKTMGKFSFLSLTGGEPFLRKDIADIATMFCKNNNVTRLSIPTNGTLYDNVLNSTKDILERNKNVDLIIKISLDGLEEDHDRIRGMRGGFKKALNTYNGLKDLGSVHQNLKLGVLITICSLNQSKAGKLYDFISSELKPDHVSLNLVRGKLKNSKLKEVNLDYYKKLHQRILSDSSQKFFRLYKRRSFELLTKTVEENRFQTDCYAGTLSAVIYEDGDVFPCELSSKKFGNLREVNCDFKKLWFNKKAEEIRKYIIESKCFCHHECNLPLNIFFNPKSYLRLLEDLIKGGEI